MQTQHPCLYWSTKSEKQAQSTLSLPVPRNNLKPLSHQMFGEAT